jgi:hypothetical protein
MATTVDTLLVRIEADLKDVNAKLRQFDKNVQTTANKADGNFKKIASVAKGVFAAAIVMQAARAGLALIKFTSGVEEMQAKSSVVFGEFVGQVRSDLEAFGDSVGRSTFELEGMASSIQDTFVPMGFARGEAAELSVQLTKLAVDVASFNNASDTATMEAFQSALVGNHETVRRFGIVITEATLQQELYRMGINKTSQEASNAEKVQARLNLIMAGTSDAHGDAARTSDSFANQSKALGAALDELAVNVLTPMLPALAGIVGGLVDATNAMNGFLDAVGIIDLDPLATKSENLAEKQKALAEAQEDLAYWTRVSNGEFEGLTDPARLAGPTLIKNKIASATEEIQRLGKESQAAFAELQKLTGADQAPQGRPAPAKAVETQGEERNIKLTNAITKAIDDQRFAAQQLKDQLDGVSESRLAANEAARGLKGITGEEIDQLQMLIDIENENQTMLDAKIKKKEDEAAADKKISDNIKQLTQDNQILALEKMNLSEVEKQLEEQRILMGGLDAEQEAQLRRLIEENLNLNKVKEDATAATEAYNAKVAEGQGIAEGFASEESKLREQIEAVNVAMQSAATEDMPLYQAAIDGLNQKIKETNPQFKAMKEAAEKAADAVADSLADAFVEGKLSMDSFKDIFKSFIKDLIKQAIKAAIIKHILGPIFGGGFAGGGSVGGGTNMGNTLLSHAGGGAVRPRAGGGPVLVGERGPELFVPHSAGVVRNNHDTKNMMGGGSPVVVNQNINIETGVAQTVRAEVMSMMPRIKSETVQAMIDGKRRGNSISKAFA